jgi:hypothetical protein
VQRSFRQSVQGFFGGRCEKASVVRAMKLSEIPMRFAVSRIDAGQLISITASGNRSRSVNSQWAHALLNR